ncbi:MAG TPA: amidohydrolase family protein [Acidimicrobiia bacterium]|nr:amidohydrolase family protein [Acidimicrobiia bacterium]
MTDLADLPRIISVDDHVVEPAHLWQDRLPAKMRERGPRIERARWGDIVLGAGASYKQEQTDDGRWGDYWMYEDRLIYLHKRHVTIPLEATPDGDTNRFDRSKLTLNGITYDEMRPGCYEPKARVDDLALAGVDGSLAFPTFPRFCGQTFLEGNDHELGLECVRAYNDWMIDEWCADSGGTLIPLCLIPLWDVHLAVDEINRNAARGAHAVCFSEIPTHLGLPSIHTGDWDPFFAACEETRTTVCMHIGSSSKMPAASPDAPPTTETMLGFYNSMASLGDYLFSGVLVRFPQLKLAYSEGQIGWIPYALERADNVWEYHAAWTNTKNTIPEKPSSYYRGRIFGCFTTDLHGIKSIDDVGEDNICFETDYPHTDTTWPFALQEAARMTAGLTEQQRYKILRGNAIRMLELDRV